MNRYRYGTKRFMIVELIEKGMTRREVFNALRPMVDGQISPMIFKANVKGFGRQPKPLSEQVIELRNEVNRVFALQGHADDGSLPKDESVDSIPADSASDDSASEIEETEEEETEEDQETEEVKPIRAKGKTRIENELQKFLMRVREIRQFCKDRERLSETVDNISMRPVQAASKLIPAGIPADALLDAMAMHWSEDTRSDASIEKFDFLALSRSIMSERGIENIGTEKVHPMFGYALVLAECRQPIMAVGPAGTGKSHLARQLHKFLDVPYGETPMSPGASRGDLLGRHTIGGFIPSQFCEIYSGGGVFNFEEIDASDPSMLIVLNNALASESLFNSANGERYDRSENFIAFSTGNTFGLGANREYTARERLDAATIDRWRMGRIFVELDETVEESILNV